jgi:predicted RNase H-like HicB family nuclease
MILVDVVYLNVMNKKDKKNNDFNGFTINLYVDEQGDWLAHFQEIPSISAFGDTPQEALEELKLAWELVKEDYRLSKKIIAFS